MSDYVLSEDLLVGELTCVAEWYTLGAFLGLTENEIKEIEQDHDGTVRRRMAMLSKWLKKETNPSWLKIISALEKMSETSLANQLKQKYTTTQPSDETKPAVEQAKQPVAHTVVIMLSRKEVVVRELEETEEKYLRLIVETESAMEAIDPSQVELKRFSRFYTSVRVTTVGELFNHLEQYCFLDYTLLQKIVSFFLKNRAQFIVDGLSTYIQDLEKFKSSTTVRQFLGNIEKAQNPLTTTNGGIETCTVVLHLVGGWLEKTMSDLDKLLKELFQDKQSVLSHIQIVRGSVIVTYYAPQWEAESLVSIVMKNMIPLHLAGVSGLMIAGTVLYKYALLEPFSFESSLYNAVLICNNRLLSFLLNINVNPDVSMHGRPVLFSAVVNGDHKAVDLLLHAGANPDLFDEDSRMPSLTFATRQKDQKTVEMLLKANANTDIQDKEGATPLYDACANGDVDITGLLLKAGANCNLRYNDGKTPLHIASFHGYSGIVDRLLKVESSRPDLQYIGGFTALYIACCMNHIDVVRLLLKANADPNIATNDGIAPLNLASFQGHLDIAGLLLNANADPNIQSDNILTPLMVACLNCEPETVRLLLSRRADPNLQHSVDKVTALLFACYSGCLKSVELLLMFGADIDMLYQNGLSALDIAAFNGHEDIVNLIQAVKLSQSSTTSPVLSVNEIAATIDNNGMSLLINNIENMLVAKSGKLILGQFKNIYKRILPSEESSQIQALVH